jgi:hypothetical protein
MKLALPLLAGLFLASCAPATLQGSYGRLVNTKTGQEGRLQFLGGFQDRAILPSDPDNVWLTVGGTVYSGRYTVLGSGSPLGLSLGIGGSYSSGSTGGGGAGSNGDSSGNGLFGSGFSGSVGSDRRSEHATRPGNLIAKTTALNGVIKTLTCTFETDNSKHGIGTCQDSAGGSYSLQF